MSLIVNGTEIENVIVVKRATGESVELELLQDINGVEIWNKPKLLQDIVIGVRTANVTSEVAISLRYYKNDETPTIIDWGDGSTSTITTYGSAANIEHEYSEKNKDYEIVISGGTFKYLGQESSTTGGTGIIGEHIAGSLSQKPSTVLQYVKLGEICKGLVHPFGSNMDGEIKYTAICYERSGTTFTGGENIPLCYYNDNLNYLQDMNNQYNHIIYDDGTEGGWIGGLKTNKHTILTAVGSAIDKSLLYQYDFDGLGYISTASDSTVVFPETLVNLYEASFGNNSVVRFLTPANKNVFIQEKFAYYKSAKSITVYTDNETIKNYDWASDNVTATIYHLDGSAWE